MEHGSAPAIFLVAAALASDVMPALGELSVTTVQRVVTVALAVILPKAVLERAKSLTSVRVPTNAPEQPSSRSAR